MHLIRRGPRPERGAPRPSAIRALGNRNFRIYILGQGVSQIGNWFQQTAEVWLIVLLTGSGTAVGVQTALRFGPLLLFGIPAGLLTDRVDRRHLLLITQTCYIAVAATIAIAAFTGTASLPLVYAIAFARGILNAVDNPLRRTFIRDLVTDDELTNAVSMNSTMHTLARFVGPALAGALIVAFGVAWCFALNAVSYVAVLISLFLIDRRALRASRRAAEDAHALWAGVRYAWENRRIRRILIMAAVLGVFALNWDVALPLYATTEFDGGASLYGFFVSTMGIGAFVGAMVVLRTTRVAGSYFRAAGLLMTVAFVILALTPVLPGAFAGLALLGAASTSFQIFAQSRLQLEADDRLSGRILALYGMALVGTRPIGALITGSIVDATNPRVALAVNATVVAILVVMILLTRQRAVEIPRGTPVALPLDADDDVTDQTDPSARRPAASGD